MAKNVVQSHYKDTSSLLLAYQTQGKTAYTSKLCATWANTHRLRYVFYKHNSKVICLTLLYYLCLCMYSTESFSGYLSRQIKSDNHFVLYINEQCRLKKKFITYHTGMRIFRWFYLNKSWNTSKSAHFTSFRKNPRVFYWYVIHSHPMNQVPVKHLKWSWLHFISTVARWVALTSMQLFRGFWHFWNNFSSTLMNYHLILMLNVLDSGKVLFYTYYLATS